MQSMLLWYDHKYNQYQAPILFSRSPRSLKLKVDEESFLNTCWDGNLTYESSIFQKFQSLTLL